MYSILVVFITTACGLCYGQNYSEAVAVYSRALGQSIPAYHTNVRPKKNQSQPVYVGVLFTLISIMEVDDIAQSFICNGFLTLIWHDEIAPWDPEANGNVVNLRPNVKDIWRPKLILSNTLGDRDLFRDHVAPLELKSDGLVIYSPGSIFPVSCKLDLSKYPLDTQLCGIQMVPNELNKTEVQLHTLQDTVVTSGSVQNGEWELIHTEAKVETFMDTTMLELNFQLKRRPAFFILNTILPVVTLSFLNILVFVIPVESGEKISYGITVLLALAVFMSLVSGMLPSSSDSLPVVVIYLFILLIISVLTVIVSIIIVFLHHKEGEEEKHLKAKANFQKTFSKFRTLKMAVSPSPFLRAPDEMSTSREQESEHSSTSDICSSMNKDGFHDAKKSPRVNRYKVIGKHIDKISFFVFVIIWAIVTVIFLAYMGSE